MFHVACVLIVPRVLKRLQPKPSPETAAG
jgi:putative tricarboxylic transport membrane protein